MDAADFRSHGQDVVDYIANYLETIGDRQPWPNVQPGYLRALIPDEAPVTGESWESVKEDIERVIMPGMTHWHSPHFHAYFPTANSYPAILGDMLSDGIACIGFTWKLDCLRDKDVAVCTDGAPAMVGLRSGFLKLSSSPACTELEVSMMDWLAKMLKLPNEFLFFEEGKGGGVIQGTASEATLVALLSARTSVSTRLRSEDPSLTQGQIIDKLVAYTSEEAHSSVERAALIGMVKLRKLPTDENNSLRGSTLESALKEDREKGLVPFFLCATIGTTSSCDYDNISELGPICNSHDVWMHVDAAYAGSACICPEFRYLLDGVEHCMSFNLNPHKWLLVNFDCSALWIKDRDLISGAFEVDPLYLKHDNQGQTMPDYRHWQIPLGRRFRSLKLWFVLRMYGVEGLQQYIRKDVTLAKQFETLVRSDSRFEIFGKVTLGLVCFRMKGPNSINEVLNKMINDDRRIHLVPSKVKDTYFLRFCVCATRTQSTDVTFAWSVIRELTDSLHHDMQQ